MRAIRSTRRRPNRILRSGHSKLGPHVRKQQYIANRGRIRIQHDQPVDSQPKSRRGRHAVFQRTHIVSRNVRAPISESAEKNRDVPWRNGNELRRIFRVAHLPSALVHQPLNERRGGIGQTFVDGRLRDARLSPGRCRCRVRASAHTCRASMSRRIELRRAPRRLDRDA